MECKELFSSAVFLDDFYEQKVEFDIVIPDYSPSAEKILCCDVVPCVLSKTMQQDKVVIGYESIANIVYTDENGIIHSVSEKEQDGKSLNMSSNPTNCKIKVGLRPISVNCRLANSRHIIVRAVLGMALKVTGNMPFCSIDGSEQLEACYHTVSANRFTVSADSLCRINGSVDVGESVTDIISSHCNVTIDDVKPINDKVVAKGNADVSVVYMTGEQKEDIKFKKFTVPFSDVIDAEGVMENSIADVSAQITDLRCETGEGNEIFVDATALLDVVSYNPIEMKIMSDAYSMKEPVCVKKSKITIESLYDRSSFSETVTANVSCDLEDARIVGIYPKAVIKGISLRDGMLNFDGEICTKIYMYNENEYKISDKVMQFSVTRTLVEGSGDLRLESDVNVANITYTMPDEKTLTLTALLNISLNCFCSDNYDAVSSIERDENEIKRCNGVVLYSAAAGEKLWDIAKKLRSSVEIIKRDNNIMSDTVENSTMLLVSFM